MRDLMPIGKKSKFFEEEKAIKDLGMHCKKICEKMLMNLSKYGSLFLSAISWPDHFKIEKIRNMILVCIYI
jgi:CRISPR/Cas system CSM-associated protein Csm5 (group 7 of RAMP superfamily)